MADVAQLVLSALTLAALVALALRRQPAAPSPMSDSAVCSVVRQAEAAVGTLAEDNRELRRLLKTTLDRALAINVLECETIRAELEAGRRAPAEQDARARAMQHRPLRRVDVPEPDQVSVNGFTDQYTGTYDGPE
jgi:hypothetical protein